LIALSSVSAFADSESSFYLGVKGLYFMPKKEISESSTLPDVPKISDVVECKTRGIFLPGLQFGYNISDSIRIGLAGYFGASKFKYEADVNLINDTAGAVGATAAKAFLDTNYAPPNDANSTVAIIKDFVKEYAGNVQRNDLYTDGNSCPLSRTTYAALGGFQLTHAGNPAPLIDCILHAVGEAPVPLIKEMKAELGPRVALFATMDAKLFESDSFSLGMGIGVGAAKWKLSVNGEVQANGESKNSADFSAWKPAFMGTVNANVAIGDVAVLTGSVGYAHLGDPKGLKSSDDKALTIDSDSNKAKGFIFGIGIGKEF